MSAEIEAIVAGAADAAAGALASLPVRKRKKGEPEEQDPNTALKAFPAQPAGDDALGSDEEGGSTDEKGGKKPVSRVREVRLEQNRKAARESRKRKKVMIEELQRSVIFFSRANGTLKQQNDELTRLLVQAQSQIAAASSGEGNTDSSTTQAPLTPGGTSMDQAQAEAVAKQAVFESQGFPAAAARAAAQSMNAGTVKQAPNSALPSMQPGATMQAMANFQQAAAAAMQNAMTYMQGIPGVNLNQLAAAPAGANAQQAYTDTMTALAMQQAAAAAAAAAGGQFMTAGMQFMPHPMMTWQPPAQASLVHQQGGETKEQV